MFAVRNKVLLHSNDQHDQHALFSLTKLPFGSLQTEHIDTFIPVLNMQHHAQL